MKCVVDTALTVLTLACGSAQNAEPDRESQQTLESVYAGLVDKTSADYVATRDRLLGMDKVSVRAFLTLKHHATTDPISTLILEALLARLGDPARLHDALSDAFAKAAEDRSTWHRLPRPGPTPPEPRLGGYHLVYQLGDDAAPLATELLCKGLTEDWATWKKQVLIYALSALGRTTLVKGDRADMVEVREPRAPWVLLRVAERAEDDECAAVACRELRRFASNDLCTAVQAARDRVASEAKKGYLSRALTTIQVEVHRIADLAKRDPPPVSTALPFRFTLDARRELSDRERAELQRLAKIGSDGEQPLARRSQAVRLLGERLAHIDCIEPLRRILDNASESQELRYAALTAMSRIADKSVVPILMAQLDDPNWAFRLRLTGQLGKFTGGQSFQFYGRTTDERWVKAVATWKQWWKENENDLVPDRMRTIMGY